jgi:hypothetical protein
VSSDHLSDHFGRATNTLVSEVFDSGVDRAVLLMRHSARTFDHNIHDLLNPLTDHGRNLSERLGRNLPKDIACRGYASPPERCIETSELVIAGHQAQGGIGYRTRPVEALGVFYALDQQRMWKGLRLTGGLAEYCAQWFAGQVAEDAMMPAPLAVALILKVLAGKLNAPPVEGARRQLDVCVTHDMTVYLMRHGVGLEPVSGPPVEFLDGLVLFRRGDQKFMRSHHGGEVRLD